MRLIDADALQAQIQQDCDIFADSTYLPDKARRDELSNVIARIIDAPTIETESVRRGKWINENNVLRCSQCGFRLIGAIPHYCQKCGAKMETEEVISDVPEATYIENITRDYNAGYEYREKYAENKLIMSLVIGLIVGIIAGILTLVLWA